MKWKKLGWLFTADDLCPELQSHASNPCVLYRNNGTHRVYYSGRDNQNRASVSYVDLVIDGDNVTVAKIANHPVLTPGNLGTFDDSGVSLARVMQVGDEIWMYYLGWNLSVTVPWRNSIGLAIGDMDGEVFNRLHEAPVMDRNKHDPFSISYPYVFKSGDEWKMWYGSNLAWGALQTDMAHTIKYATSLDGINWHPTGQQSLQFLNSGEYAISRPHVIFENGIYKMWYSFRGDSYRIGYAESQNGVEFIRKDSLAGIDVSESGWDSESIEYPNVFDYRGHRYMLYNGNRYGLTGFGIAKLIER